MYSFKEDLVEGLKVFGAFVLYVLGLGVVAGVLRVLFSIWPVLP